MGNAPVVAAVITAAVAVIGIVVSQASTWARENRHRLEDRERAAVLEVQDAALAVRRALRALGTASREAARDVERSRDLVVPLDPAVEDAQSDAEGLLDVRLARLTSRELVEEVRAWQQDARFAFLGDDDVTTRDEALAWTALQDVVARVLSGPAPSRSWRLRRRSGPSSGSSEPGR